VVGSPRGSVERYGDSDEREDLLEGARPRLAGTLSIFATQAQSG
jgi:hypothetical protein